VIAAAWSAIFVAGESLLGDDVALTDASTAAATAVRGSAARRVAVSTTRCWLNVRAVCTWVTRAAVAGSLDSTVARSAAASASELP